MSERDVLRSLGYNLDDWGVSFHPGHKIVPLKYDLGMSNEQGPCTLAIAITHLHIVPLRIVGYIEQDRCLHQGQYFDWSPKVRPYLVVRLVAQQPQLAVGTEAHEELAYLMP